MRKFTAAFFVLLLASSASATTIGSENVTVDVSSSEVEVDMHVEDLTSSSLSYLTSYEVHNVRGTIDSETVDCEVENLQLGSEITCETEKRKNFTTHLEFEAEGLVNPEQDLNVFSYTQSVYRPVENYRLQVVLPEGAGLVDSKNVTTPVVTPSNYEVSSNGRRIFVEWEQNPELGQNLEFRIMYEEFSNRLDYLKLLAAPLALVILTTVAYIVWKRKNREDIEKVYEELEQDQVEILEVLRENGGEMLQKDVVSETGYSKAKISGVVSDLVDEEIVVKEKEGRSNKLKIAKRYRK